MRQLDYRYIVNLHTKRKYPVSLGNFWYVFNRFLSSKARHTLYWVSQRFPIQGISHLIFFQYNVIYHSNARFTFYWQRVGMSSPIEGENISSYHSNSRCSFIYNENIIQYKVFRILGSVFLEYKVATFFN